MPRGIASLALGAALLAGCAPDDTQLNQDLANIVSAPAAPEPIATSPAVIASPLAKWLVGSWSAEKSCTTDFMAHYNADGSLAYGEDTGIWVLVGDTVTEQITQRPTMAAGSNATSTEPERRAYRVAKIDEDHGTITFESRKIAIQRC